MNTPSLRSWITLSGSHYEAQIAGENPRVTEILSHLGDDQLRRFVPLAFEFGVELLERSGQDASVMALGDQLKVATDTASIKLESVAGGVSAAVEAAYLKHVGPNSTLDLKIKGAIDTVVASLDPERGAAVGKLLGALRIESDKAASAMVAEVQKSMNVNDPNSSIGVLTRSVNDMKTAMVALQEQHAAQLRLDAVKKRTPIKGTTLQSWVGEVLAPLASARCESFDCVATIDGAINERMVGDFVTQLDGSVTGGLSTAVVIEAKNRKKSYGALRAELEVARQNRCALAAFGVMSHPRLAADLQIFGKHDVILNLPDFGEPDFDHVAAEKLMAAGLQVARLLAIAALKVPAMETVDLARFKAICEKFAETTKLRIKLKGEVTHAKGAVDSIDQTVRVLDASLSETTEMLEQAIADELRKVTAKASQSLAGEPCSAVAPLPLTVTVLNGSCAATSD